MTLQFQLVEDRALAEARFGVISHLLIWIELRGLGRQERQEDVALLLLDETESHVTAPGDRTDDM